MLLPLQLIIMASFPPIKKKKIEKKKVEAKKRTAATYSANCMTGRGRGEIAFIIMHLVKG